MNENESKPKGELKYTDEDKVSILVHEMIHDLIIVLNTQPREIGAMAMMELLVSHSPFKDKKFFLCHLANVWDAFKDSEGRENDK